MYQGKFEQSYKEQQKQMPPLSRSEAKPLRKGPRLGGAVFYLIFFAYIFAFYLATYCGLTILRNWLTEFEAAQPTRKCQQVFDTLFASRDWDALYDAAGIRGESRESFADWMDTTVGDGKLTYMETSAGLSGNRKYNVRLDDRKFASFTLNKSETDTGLPDWQLGEILFLQNREETYFLRIPTGCIARVNGEILEDSSKVRISGRKADAYLPEGVTGPGTETYKTSGLPTKPAVTVQNADGSELPVLYEEASRTFTAQAEIPAIADAERTVALDAVKMYALYMIERAGADEVARYFARGTDTYTAIVKTDRSAVQDAQKREFVDEAVTDYCRYSDGSFSVRVAVTLNQYRSNGSVKADRIEQSLFFRKESGKWKCWQMTAVDISATTEQVRLVFKNGETVLSDAFWDASAARLTCPAVTPPEGQVFAGWTVESRDESGRPVLRLVFQPDAQGVVMLPGEGLEPMILQPLFETP